MINEPNTNEFGHVPVMPAEVIEGLGIKPGGVYLDGTAGAGGHSFLIASRLNNDGRLICMDQDARAINTSLERLKGFSNITFIKENFANANKALAGLGLNKLNGALLDLGCSSMQLDEADRGFSFLKDARLDMRMDRDSDLTASDVINGYSAERLSSIFKDYGEERFSGRIARAITEAREKEPIISTLRLADLVSNAIPRRFWEKHKHPATRVFQAVRIEVNNELNILSASLRNIVEMLLPGGRFCVITFHSLEDRIVKNTFQNLIDPCDCPKDLPQCVCGKKPSATKVTKKHKVPSALEQAENVRSRSAKLRIIEKI